MLKAEPLNILAVQVYIPTSYYKDDRVTELLDLIEEILAEKGRGETNAIIIDDWNNMVGDKSYRIIFEPHVLGRCPKGKRSLTVEKMALLSPARGLRSLRENSIPGKHQEIEREVSWTLYL
jgi:hypothetical protein